MSTHGRAGKLLIKAGVIDAAGLARALAVESTPDTTFGRLLSTLGLAEESVVAAAIASTLHLEYLEGDPPELTDEVAELLPEDLCRKFRTAPLAIKGGALKIAVTDPLDYSTTQAVEFRTGMRAITVVVTQSWLEALFSRRFSDHVPERAATYDLLFAGDPAGEVETAIDYEAVDLNDLAKEGKLPPIVRLVNLILSDAAKAGASDVHVEPHETELHIRQRVDGLLRDVLMIPRHLQDATISRLKIMAGMDIAERRKPQDGRSRLRFKGRRIDLRVSTMPMQFGEKVVIRLLNTDKAVPRIDQLGFSSENLRLLKGFLSRPQGMILVTGPTGSGKTSTLYSALASIQSPTNNIITLEDPIEMQVAGVNQMQVNPRAGVTFASGLRSILRQDPNVILVGEIRDQETADIALGAAQTGHLLLSTLHTNDATATITRLFDLGIQPFLIASSLVGIIAQRLVRRVCPACQVPHPPSEEAIEKAGGAARLPANAKWVAGRGCDQCDHSGLKGRLAIHEVLAADDEMRDLIATRAAEHLIKKAARQAGMRTLLEDGIDKAARGLTTLEEVLRVVAHSETGELDASAETSAVAPSVGLSEAVSTTAGGRVLVVEDSATIVSVVRYFLELEGFEVTVAENGLLGLEIALRERPDVIVSDVNMPGMGGLAMVKAIRAHPGMSEIGILMLTSETSVEAETECLAAGADDYILKPVEPRRLAARVKVLRARSRSVSS
jgi:type II secretory ATPase GspE/PulE/Tfp pilus assembly ATPase PilB-like protein/ActR/RegA family two-component response regulator